MKNNLELLIMKVKQDIENGEPGEDLLEELLRKQAELGDDPSKEAINEAIAEIIFGLESKLLGSHDEISEMEEDICTVRNFLDKNEWLYFENRTSRVLHAFELGVNHDGKRLKVAVELSSAPMKGCKIDITIPFCINDTFAYPLCEQILKVNQACYFGGLQFSQGRICYTYRFPVVNGLNEKVFETVFMLAVRTVYDSYDVLSRYAVGRYRKAEAEQIVCSTQGLLIELTC